MQTNTNPSPNDMGLGSMVGYLSAIATNTTEEKNILNTINAKLDSVVSSFETNFVKLYDETKTKITRYIYNIESNTKLLVDKFDLFLATIYDRFGTTTSRLSNPNELELNNIIIRNHSDMMLVLRSISNTLKSANNNSNTNSESNNSADFDNTKKSGLAYMNGFVKSLSLMKKTLTDRFINQIGKFISAFNKMIDEKATSKKIEAFNTNALKFAESIGILSKKVRSAAMSFGIFTLAFGAMMFVTASPMMALSLLMFAGFIGLLTRLTGDKEVPKDMIQFGVGILLLAGSMLLLQKIDYATIFKTLVFIGGLSLVMGGFGDVQGDWKSIMGLGLGILILSFALENIGNASWGDIFKLIIFTKGLSWAMKAFGGSKGIVPSSLLGVGLGLGLLTLAVYAFSNIPIQNLYRVIGALMAIGIAARMMSGKRNSLIDIKVIDISTGGSPIWSMAKGIALLTLALSAFGEIPLSNVLLIIGTIIAIAMSVRLFDQKHDVKIMGNVSRSSLMTFAFGLALVILALDAVGEISWKAPLILVSFIAALGLAMKLHTGLTKANGVGFLLLSGGIIVLSYALSKYKEVGWTPFDALGLVVTIALLGIVFALAGTVSKFILIGSLAIGSIFAVIYLSAIALNKIQSVNIDFDKILNFGLAAGSLMLIYVVMALLAIPAMIGAVAFLPIAVVSLLSALALLLISKLDKNIDIANFVLNIKMLAIGYSSIFKQSLIALPAAIATLPIMLITLLSAGILAIMSLLSYDSENVIAFLSSVTLLVSGYNQFSLTEVAKALAKSVALIPVFLSTLLGGVVLALISMMTFDDTSITKYDASSRLLVDGINSFGIIELGKAAIKATELLPVYAATYLGALAMKEISEIEFDNGKLQAFPLTLSGFTDNILTVVADNADKLKKAKPGIDALAAIVNIGGSLASTITELANMYYNVYGVNENGELIIVERKKIGPEEMLAVGTNFGKLLACLVDPLLILGSDDDELTFGTTKVKNPFKSKQTRKGIETLQKLMDAFTPLTENITRFAELDMARNPVGMVMFNSMLRMVIDSFVYMFNRLNEVRDIDITKPITTIGKFIDDVGRLNANELLKINNIMEIFINNLSANDKWDAINKNLENLKKHFLEVSKAINTIDIKKAMSFENVLKQITTEKNSKHLKEAVEKLADLLEMISTDRDAAIQARQFEIENAKVQQALMTVPGMGMLTQQQSGGGNNADNNNNNNDYSEMILQITNAISTFNATQGATNQILLGNHSSGKAQFKIVDGDLRTPTTSR